MASLAVYGFLLSLSGPLCFSCMCGYIQPEGFFVTLPGAFLCWLSFFGDSYGEALTRLLKGVAVVLATLVLYLNLHHVLWSGHEPLFKQSALIDWQVAIV